MLFAMGSIGWIGRAAVTQAQAFPLKYPEPALGAVTVTRDVVYGRVDTATLRMDVYRGARARGVQPAIVFFNTAVGAQRRENEFYRAWARIAASKGLTAIVPDLRSGTQPRDFAALVAHLVARGTELGVDTAAIAVYAASGNMSAALPIVQDPTMTGVKSAVMLYGGATVAQFRRDLPLLLVRAGLDRPAVNANTPTGLAGLAALALMQNAPVTIINDAGGHHAFEMVDDGAVTRHVIDAIIGFTKRTTARSYQTALHAAQIEISAAASMATGHFADAVRGYASLVATQPDDVRVALAYGEALLGNREFALACAELDKLKGKGLGARDLGVPAAKACVQAGEPDAAIAWLSSIPRQFRPMGLKDDPVFVPLHARAEFQALFQP